MISRTVRCNCRSLLLFLLLGVQEAPCDDACQLPAQFDLRESGILTPVKHQLNCGSCGEFAAVAVAEALIKKNTGETVDLSEQQIVSCVEGCGCVSGCSSLRALEYVKEHGIALETDYPYLNKDTNCIDGLPARYFLTDVLSKIIDGRPLRERIEIIKETIIEYGPVATNLGFYADLDRYTAGVYSWDGKSKEMGGHWVVIVGWKDDPGLPSRGYWICRNSWGDEWGEGGYFNSAYGDATGIDDYYIVFGTYRRDKEKDE